MSDSDSIPSQDLEALQQTLGHSFQDVELLESALRHASFAHESPGRSSNERLEFLGDAVVGLVVAHCLFEAHRDWSEGDLTRGLSALVDKQSLAELGRRVGLGRFILLGRTERSSAGETKETILADATEAVIGALFLDGGLEAVRAFVVRSFAAAFEADAPKVGRDPKTLLQELMVAQSGSFPSYRMTLDTGIEGDGERFEVEVWVERERLGRGLGRSKRLAERAAAETALDQISMEADACDG